MTSLDLNIIIHISDEIFLNIIFLIYKIQIRVFNLYREGRSVEEMQLVHDIRVTQISFDLLLVKFQQG